VLKIRLGWGKYVHQNHEGGAAETRDDDITEAEAETWLESYKAAWIDRSVEKAMPLFTPTVDYREKRFNEPLLGHADLRSYWEDRVFEHQRDVTLHTQIWAVRDQVLIAGWQATFTWLPINGIIEADGVCRAHLLRQDGAVRCARYDEWMDLREFR
jgi:hypothetical protein